MIRILRWLLGYTEFKIEGNTDLFISNFRAILWNVRKKKGNFYANCLTKNYNQILHEASRFESCLTKVHDFGFLNFLRRYVLRRGLVVGFIVFLFLLLISNFFVWNVELQGNVQIPDEKIYRVCDSCGLHFGAFIFGVDENKIEFKLKKTFKEISWVSVNRMAGKYVIKINEGDLKPKLVADPEQPCNIVAAFDGLVLSVKPTNGFVQVKAGDYVKKNQVLVSAIKQNKKYVDVLYAHSDAEIIAKVERFNRISLPKASVRKQKTGKVQTFDKIKLFGLKIPVESKKLAKNSEKAFEYSEPIEFLGIRLPIMCEKSVYDVFDEIKIKNKPSQIKRMLLNKQREWETTELNNAKILSRNYDFSETANEIVLNAEVLVCQRIDQKQPIELSEEEGFENYYENERNLQN